MQELGRNCKDWEVIAGIMPETPGIRKKLQKFGKNYRNWEGIVGIGQKLQELARNCRNSAEIAKIWE